ncbi:MAG: hypothetical protein GY869_17310 [Planctomycetes bacterium]|nr:hypothetical protein [Planctomycetota bacterium]
MAKNPQINQKRWFSDGPAMDYPARYRSISWLINLGLYALLNMFYMRMLTGQWISQGNTLATQTLIEQLPLNLFHFPSLIIIIGLIMALLCTAPIITAQFYNLLYAVPFVLVALFLGQNKGLSLCLFVSCAAISFELLRFKSKFVAALLCLIPVVLYWILFSGPNPEQDALRWAIIYAPWGFSFLFTVMIIGLVITIGHFVRYRPGVLTPIFGLMLAGTVLLFHFSIGMQERDFQAQVYRNNPSQITAFQNRSIVPLLEKEVADKNKEQPFLEPETLKEQIRLNWRRSFFATRMELPASIDYSTPAATEVVKFLQGKIDASLQLDNFIANSSPQDRRVADAQYFRALLNDINVDLRALRDNDFLRFSSDTPHPSTEKAWKQILDQFPEADVSIEARYRLARLYAAAIPQKPGDPYRFVQALDLLQDAQQRCDDLIQQRKDIATQENVERGFFADIFTQPQPALSNEQLTTLQIRIGKLITLINQENRIGMPVALHRLAEFVGLDILNLDYESRLTELRLTASDDDPLLDNIILAQTLLEPDIDLRIDQLTYLTKDYQDCDAGALAMSELAQLLMEKYLRSDYPGDRESLRSRSAELLQKIITLRPDTFLAQHAQKLLEELPPVT